MMLELDARDPPRPPLAYQWHWRQLGIGNGERCNRGFVWPGNPGLVRNMADNRLAPILNRDSLHRETGLILAAVALEGVHLGYVGSREPCENRLVKPKFKLGLGVVEAICESHKLLMRHRHLGFQCRFNWVPRLALFHKCQREVRIHFVNGRPLSACHIDLPQEPDQQISVFDSQPLRQKLSLFGEPNRRFFTRSLRVWLLISWCLTRLSVVCLVSIGSIYEF